MVENGNQVGLIFMVLFTALTVVGLITFVFKVYFPWIRAKASGSSVRAFDIMGMRLRGNPVRLIVDAQLALLHSGIEVSIAEIERTYMVHRSEVRDMKDLVHFVRNGGEKKAGEVDDLA